MSITISLSPEVEQILKSRAAAAGQDVADYTAKILESIAHPRSLEELSGPVHRRFVETGETEEQLGEALEQAKHEMRVARSAQREMTGLMHHVVYDCVVYAQALINPGGSAGECVDRARRGEVRLFVSEYIINEIRELDQKIPSRYNVTRKQLDDLADQVILFGTFISVVPSVYLHPHDPDDSHYVDLCIVSNSKLIVSRDRHLLNLMDESRPDGKEFKDRFPDLAILTPENFIQRLRAEKRL